jgi:hypothetical protein
MTDTTIPDETAPTKPSSKARAASTLTMVETAHGSERRLAGEDLWATLALPWSGPVCVTGPYQEHADAERAASHIIHADVENPPCTAAGLTWPLKLIPPGADLACTLLAAADRPSLPWPPVPGTHVALNRVRSRAIKRTQQPPDRGCDAVVLAVTPDLVYAVLIGPFPDMRTARYWTWGRASRSKTLDLPHRYCAKVLPLQPLTHMPATSAQNPGTAPHPARRPA